MATIYLVSCVSKKKNVPIAAKDLYDSEWFKRARAYVEVTGCCWFILCAKYGLLEPDAIVTPYEETLTNMDIGKRREWAERVLVELKKILGPSDHVVFLAGSKYREFLVNKLRGACASIQVPMAGLRIGEQLRWLGHR